MCSCCLCLEILAKINNNNDKSAFCKPQVHFDLALPFLIAVSYNLRLPPLPPFFKLPLSSLSERISVILLLQHILLFMNN